MVLGLLDLVQKHYCNVLHGDLRDSLGVRLLHRTTRKLSLTEAGERFFEHAAQALTAADQAEDAVTELQGEPQGTKGLFIIS
jgi:DNA-binding transcriptional LysR family regulator